MDMNPTPPSLPEVRRALARSIGLAAFVYGYPLIETYRTCRLQTDAGAARATGLGLDMRGDFDTLHHSQRPSTHEDRDVVTPANDLLYSLAWIHLADGPRLLTVPSSAAHPGRYFVLALYDAYTENFENLGPRNCAPEGETVVLVGPGGQVPEHLAGHRLVHCPSNLVWLIGRWLKTPGGSQWWQTRVLRLPMLGGLLRNYQLTLFARSLGTLLGNGVPLLTALRIATETVGNQTLRAPLEREVPQVKEGERVADAIDSLVPAGVSAILFNCCQPEVIEGALKVASARLQALGRTDIRLGAYANAFPPQPKEATANDGLDEIRADLGPQDYLGWAERWRGAGASLIGGCCGIGPEHIEALASRLR